MSMDFQWKFFIDMGVISIALLLATLIRAKVPFLQKYLIPNALTAGFLLLPFYNYLAPLIGMSQKGLGELVYHLLSISFIAMTLRKATSKRPKGHKGIISTSVAIISQYSLQGLLGMLLTFLFMSTLIPGLFPTFGLFIPLGFALGPGQSFAIGQGWESFGFTGAGSVGMTFAAIGFLWACFGGVFLINFGIRKGWLNREKLQSANGQKLKTGIYPKDKERPAGSHLTTETEAIDSMSYNLAMVLFVYLCSYLLLHLLTFLLSFAGDLGKDLAVNLWGISFVFAALMALVFKQVLKLLKVEFTLDNGSLTRISGTSVDVMVAGAVGAISLVVVAQYWLPILIMCMLAGIMVITTVPWLCSRIFSDHQFYRTLIIYGACTGTLPTGLALLRVIDPNFETPAAQDYMYATAVIFALVIPLILAINLPAYSYTESKPLYFWLMVAILGGYLVFALILHVFIAKKRAFKVPGRLWFPGEK